MKVNKYILLIILMYLSTTYSQIITLNLQSNNQYNLNEYFVEISYLMDLTKTEEKLGSYSCTVNWNPSEIIFEELVFSETDGLSSPIVNYNDISLGKVKIANANPLGNVGELILFSIRFKVNEGSSINSHEITFTSLSAAYTFNDLLNNLTINETITDVKNQNSVLEYSFEMYPNPFNPSINIAYQVAEEGKVELKIYNILGQQIKELVNENRMPGKYQLEWNGMTEDGTSVSSGIYFLVLNSKSFRESKKIVMLK